MRVAKTIDRFEGEKGPGFTMLLSNGDFKFWGFTDKGRRLLLVWDSKAKDVKYTKAF